MNKILTLVCLLLAVAPVSASDGPLKSRMDAYTVSFSEDGQESLAVAEKAVPGSIIEYQLAYENVSEDPLSGLVVTGPVPAGVNYLGASANSDGAADLQASYDGGESWHNIPVMRIVTDENGVAREEEVPSSQYTHLRWTAVTPLAANATSKYSYRVQVNTE